MEEPQITRKLGELHNEYSSHMDPKFKEAMKLLYDEVQNVEGSEGVKQILDLAFQMDEKGEFWKFEEVFGPNKM